MNRSSKKEVDYVDARFRCGRVVRGSDLNSFSHSARGGEQSFLVREFDFQ